MTRVHVASLYFRTDYDAGDLIAKGWEVACWCGTLGEWLGRDAAVELAAEHARTMNPLAAMRRARVVAGTQVTAVVPINGIRCARSAVLVGMLRSGRLLLDVPHRGTTHRVITDPSNVRMPASFRH